MANLRNCAAIPENLADGMVLVVDYWQSQNLNWLDGVGCGYGKEYCAVSYTGGNDEIARQNLVLAWVVG